MNRSMVILAVLLVLGITDANAQMGGGKTGEQAGQTGQGMMMRDMMQMMMDIMRMQKNMMREMKPAEKKEMMKESDKMMERMEKMMAEMRGMMMQGMMGGMAYAEPRKEGQKTQERAEAGVTVKISLEEKDGNLSFKIVLDTHTVNLDGYKFDEIVVLRANGKEYKARVKSQEGSGHHRSAVVEFDNPKTKEVEVVIKDVAGVKERVFKFQP